MIIVIASSVPDSLTSHGTGVENILNSILDRDICDPVGQNTITPIKTTQNQPFRSKYPFFAEISVI